MEEITSDNSENTVAKENFREMVFNVLESDANPDAKEIYEALKSGNVTKAIDNKMVYMSSEAPYCFIFPPLRKLLGLSIQTDEKCVEVLNELKGFLDAENKDIIENIIEFINGGELRDDIYPETDLYLMLHQIPEDRTVDLHNCAEYIIETTKTEDEA